MGRSPGMAAFLVRLKRDSDEREMDSKGCPLPDPAAFGADVAAMQLDQLLDNSQSEPQSAMSTSCRCIPLLKPVENIRQKPGCDAFTGINDADFHVCVDAFEQYLDHSVLRSKPDRVA